MEHIIHRLHRYIPSYLFMGFFLLSTLTHAQETVPEATASGLAVLDWIIIAVYALSTIGQFVEVNKAAFAEENLEQVLALLSDEDG